jgi:hypothetical protein
LNTKKASLDVSDGVRIQLQWNEEGVTFFMEGSDGERVLHRFHPIEWHAFAAAVANARDDGPGDDDAELFGPISGACRRCGCTDYQGCPDGCEWVQPDLCSTCVGLEKCPDCESKHVRPSDGGETASCTDCGREWERWTGPAEGTEGGPDGKA